MYLQGRWELPVNSNPFFALQPWSDQANLTQCQSAARLVGGLLRWLDKVRMGRLEPPEPPHCVYQMPLQVATARVARRERDELVITPSSAHLAVLCGSRFYTLRVFDPSGAVMDEATLAQRFEEIKGMAKAAGPVPAGEFVGALSAGHRDAWADARAALLGTAANAQALKDLDSALYVVCLDDEVPADLNRECRLFLTGDGGKNRYWDKHAVVALGDGRLAVTFEHAFSDGVTWNRKLHEAWCWGEGRPPAPGIELYDPPTTSDLPPALELKWELTAQDKENITKAEEAAGKLMDNLQIQALDFQEFGKSTFKKWQVSPDAAVQLGFQLAFTRCHEELAPVYEACSTAGFLHGRTETLRSCSPEAAGFIEAMMAPGTHAASKLEAFRRAAAKHVALAKEAKMGLGVDRHFLALKAMAAIVGEEAQHPLFDDPLFKLTGTWILSTSNVSAPHNRHFGFGAVTGQGYGLGYIIGDDRVSVDATNFVSSGKTDSAALAEQIGEAWLELNALVEKER